MDGLSVFNFHNRLFVVRSIQYSRAILLVLFLTLSPRLYADYGWLYFFKCKVVTSDTTFTGFIRGPYEYLSDTTLSQFREDDKFFKDKLLADITTYSGKNAMEIIDFVYVHQFYHERALFQSKNSVHAVIGDVKSLELINIVAFHSQPHSVISLITPEDTLWCRKEPLKKIDNSKTDECCSQTFLIYNKKVRYMQIIQGIMAENDAEKRERLLKDLRKYKIVAVRVCSCG